MKISEILQDSQQHVKKFLEQFPQLYQEFEPDILEWLECTEKLRDKLEPISHNGNHENFIEVQLQHGENQTEIVFSNPKTTLQESVRESISPNHSIHSSPKSRTLCSKCSENMKITTTLEPAPQHDYVTIVSHYECPRCGFHDVERVALPRDIALQQYNLEQLMKGV